MTAAFFLGPRWRCLRAAALDHGRTRRLGTHRVSLHHSAWSFGKRLTSHVGIATLIGFQGPAFRGSLLWMGFNDGFVSVQMTWEGQNLDVLTGLTAPVAAALVVWARLPGRLELMRTRPAREHRQHRDSRLRRTSGCRSCWYKPSGLGICWCSGGCGSLTANFALELALGLGARSRIVDRPVVVEVLHARTRWKLIES